MKIEYAPSIKLKRNLNEGTDFINQEHCVLSSKTEELSSLIKESKEKIAKLLEVKHTVVVGMGGSSLGVKAFSCLLGLKNISFLDQLCDYKVEKVLSTLDLETTVFLVTSKSGNTTETIALFQHLVKVLEEKKLAPKNHIHAVTVLKNKSALLEMANKLGINVFDYPKELSGRFSMFGFPGLLPLSLSGVDIDEINKGLKSALIDSDKVNDLSEVLMQSIEKKDFGQNFWTYDGRLIYFRAWLRQLISESLGKSSKTHPDYSLPPFIECRGSTDQHSYLQHVLALPKRSLNFVFETHMDEKLGLLDQRQAKEAEKLKGYFTKYEIRFVDVVLKKLNTSNVSHFFAVWMFVIQLVGEHYGLNVFKQDNIDELKKMDQAKKNFRVLSGGGDSSSKKEEPIKEKRVR